MNVRFSGVGWARGINRTYGLSAVPRIGDEVLFDVDDEEDFGEAQIRIGRHAQRYMVTFVRHVSWTFGERGIDEVYVVVGDTPKR